MDTFNCNSEALCEVVLDCLVSLFLFLCEICSFVCVFLKIKNNNNYIISLYISC